MKTEIITYDSHYLYLECMTCLLEKNGFGKDYDFLNTINFDQIENFISDKTSILIMNIVGLGLSDTFDFIENTLKRFCNLKIMILSPNMEMKVIKKFFEKGAKSFLTKNTNSTEFVKALKAVIEGKVYINDDAKKSLFDYICNQEELSDKKSYGGDELTCREKDVLALLCDGYRTKEIADKLFISTHTVESHRRNIMLKLNVNNSSKLVKLAMENNLVN